MSTKKTVTLTDAALVWRDYWLMFSGRTKEVVQGETSTIYKKASGRATVPTDYMELVPYLCGKAAGAFALPLSVVPSGNSLESLFSRSREELDQAWNLAWCSGHTFGHLVRRDGETLIEHVWPDDVTVVADPANPRRWNSALSVSLVLSDDTQLVYRRDGETWTMETQSRKGLGVRLDVPVVTGLPICPVQPITRGRQASLNDPPRSFARDMAIGLGRKLTATEFRSIYRTSQMWRRSELGASAAAMNIAAPVLESAPDAVIELDSTGAVGVVESSNSASGDLDANLGWLRLGCVMLNLPPEVFPFVSRSETGAARAYDFWPQQRLEEKDRAVADEMLARLLFVWAKLLPLYGVAIPENARIRTVSPAGPPPTDRLQEALGIEEEWRQGRTDPVYEFARSRGYALPAAEALVKRNKASYDKAHQAPEPITVEVPNADSLEVGKTPKTSRP